MKMISASLTLLIFCLIFVVNSNGQKSDPLNSSENQTNKQKGDKPIKIKRKPQAAFGPGTCSQSSGRISVRATFDKSAKVTNVEIVSSSGCDRFDRNATSAAKRIKFEPAIKNGEPVTVVKLVEYTFTQFIR
jgi:TonB family protein